MSTKGTRSTPVTGGRGAGTKRVVGSPGTIRRAGTGGNTQRPPHKIV